ncbi:MAG: MarR family transcriptional regulator [Hyphomonadaceae bacterium]|nr:MarR family transcriptional regulator [Hyphomonadaceae bacterium]
MAADINGVNWLAASAFPGPQASPGFRFWRSFMVWQRGLNETLRPHDLTQPQFALLATIAWLTQSSVAGGPVPALSQQALADFLGLERMHVSQVLARLEGAGLISRTQPMQDRRAKGLAVTAAGTQRLTAALPVVEAYDRAFFEAATGPVPG